MEAADEHRVLVEDVADGGSVVVSEVCGDSSAPSARLDAQGGGVDAQRDGQAMLDGAPA